MTLIAVRAEGETELKLNPGLTHVLQEKDTVFYIGFTREEYSKVRGPVNTRHTLWHACASWAVLAMATSGINPYELEEKYGSHEVKVDVGEEVKGDLEQDGVSLMSSGGEDPDVKFYLGGDHNSSSELKLAETAVVHKRPSQASQTSSTHKRPSMVSQTSSTHKQPSQASQMSSTHKRPSQASQMSAAVNLVNHEDDDDSLAASLTKEELDDQQRCDMLRGVKLLRFHSQPTNSHASVPVKVNLLHRDSSTGLSSLHPPGPSSSSSSHAMQRKSSAPVTLLQQSSIPVNAMRKNSIPVNAMLHQATSPHHAVPQQDAVLRQDPNNIPYSVQIAPDTAAPDTAATTTTTTTTQSADPLLKKSPEPPLYSEPSDLSLPAVARGSHVCFKRLSDVPEEVLLDTEKSMSALSEKALLCTLKDAEEGRVSHNGRGIIHSGHDVQDGRVPCVNSHAPSSQVAIELSSMERSVHVTRHVTYQPPPNAEHLQSDTKQINLIPPPLNLNITRSASEGKLPGVLEVVDPDTPSTLCRGGFYSSEQSILNPSTPSSAVRHVGMRMPSPVFARRHPTILSNFSRKLSMQGERMVPPVMQEEVCI